MEFVAAPPYVLHVCETLRRAGFQAYVVGGGVRDALLGRRPKDWDVATDAPPDRVQRLFPKTVATGLRFGTVTVLVRDDVEDAVRGVEVTTFRGEGAYRDGRRPEEVRFLARIEDDLVRRDFTINAIAYEPAEKVVVDPCGGRDDLARRWLRAVGDADARFEEDGLRVLRAVRLAAELGFDIEPATEAGLRRNRRMLGRVSRERVGDEWRRMLASDEPGRGLRLLHRYALLPYIFSGGRSGGGTGPGDGAVEAVAEALDRTPSRDAVAVRTALVLHGLGARENWRPWLEGLVYPKRWSDRALHIADRWAAFDEASVADDPGLRRFLSSLGRSFVQPFFDGLEARRPEIAKTSLRRRAEDIVASGQPLTMSELAVDGYDVRRLLGAPPGPDVGRLLQRLLDHVLERPEDNEQDRLRALLLAWTGKGTETRQ